MSDVFKALSDPTRRKILQLLRAQDLSAGDISKEFEMSKPAISKHLDILKNADLIDCVKRGQFVVYSINTTDLQNTLQDFLSFFEHTKSEAAELKQQNEKL